MLLLVAAGRAIADDTLKLDDETIRINYSLGYQIGVDFKRQSVKMNAAAVVKGIEDAMAGGQPLISQPEMHETLVELKRRVVKSERVKKQAIQEQRIADGDKYMKENATKPGVQTTDSGLQYRIFKPGTGKTPKATDRVTVNYRGTLVNGNEFDSSDTKPATFALNGVIKGWTEGLQLIREGGKIQLVIPPQLAYGSRGPLENQTLVFDIELISVGEQAQ
jgi:FKBP-type peptidyl-prolyl cis-trans isomerase FklB